MLQTAIFYICVYICVYEAVIADISQNEYDCFVANVWSALNTVDSPLSVLPST